MTENEISKKIIGCAINVHKLLGPGLLESAYQECLFYEIKEAGLVVKSMFGFRFCWRKRWILNLNETHFELHSPAMER